MKNRLRKELEAMLGLHTGDSFTADNVHTLVNGIFAADEGGGFEFVEYDDNAFPYPQTIGDTTESIEGLGSANEKMIHTIFIMPNKSTNPDATLMIVVDEVDPSTDPKTYQYVYVGNINDLPSDVLTEGSIVNDLTSGGTDKPLSAEQGRTLNSHVNYTTCGSGAGDQVKLISDDGFELSTHLRLLVKMNNTNTNSTPKFNINNTGVKDVWYNGAVASDTNTWASGEVLDVYYDGGKYITNTHGGAQFSTGEKVGDVGIDNEPTAGSDNLVKSGGVEAFLKNNLYDIPKCIINILNFAVEYTPYISLRLTFSAIQFISYPNNDNSGVVKNFTLNNEGTIDTVEFNASNGYYIYLLTDGTSPCLVQSSGWNPGLSKYLAFRFLNTNYSTEEQSFSGILTPFITQYFTFKTDKTVKQLSIDFNEFALIKDSIEGIQSATILNLSKSGQFNLGGLCDLNINNIKPHIDAFEPWWYIQGVDGGAKVVYNETEQALKITSGDSGYYCGLRTNIFSYLVPGKEYTFSIDIKSIQTTVPLFIGLQYPTASSINITIPTSELDGEWHTYTKTFIAEDLGYPEDTSNPFYYIGIFVNSNGYSGLSFFAKNFKLKCSSNTTKDLKELSDKVDETNEKLIPLSVLNNNFDKSGELDLIEATDTQINASMELQSDTNLGWVLFRATSEFDSLENCIILTKNNQNYGAIRTDKIRNQFDFGKEYKFSVEIKVPVVYDIRISINNTTSAPENIVITPEDTDWHTYEWSLTPYFPLTTWTTQIGFNTNAPNGAKIYIRNITCVTDNLYKQLEFAYNFAKDGGHLDLTGKKISIIGDSISCFGTESQTRNDGYNAPYWVVKSEDVGQQIQSYVTWLDVYNTINAGSTLTNKTIGGVLLTPAMIGTLQTFTPIQEDIGKCIGVARWAGNYTTKPWWQVLIDKTGATLCNNASWSGSRIVPIPEGNVRHDAFVLSEAYSDYTINRCASRDDNGNVINPDIVFIYRGTNDFVATDPEGGSGPNIPEDITTPDMKTFVQITDDYNFTQGYIWTILKLRQKYPNAYIVLCTLNVFKYVNYSHYPSNNGTYTLPEYCNKIREIADLMGCGLIEFDKDGITFENCYPTYISDNSTTPLHPNTNGHRVMGEKAVSDLKYYLKVL